MEEVADDTGVFSEALFRSQLRKAKATQKTERGKRHCP